MGHLQPHPLRHSIKIDREKREIKIDGIAQLERLSRSKTLRNSVISDCSQTKVFHKFDLNYGFGLE